MKRFFLRWRYLAVPLLLLFFVFLHKWAHPFQSDSPALPRVDLLLLWGINALVVGAGFVTVRRMLFGKKLGYVGGVFALSLIVSYLLILHDGDVLDLLG